MAVSLRNCQLKAVRKMKNGCILCGDVGSGKSRTSLAYYYIEQEGIIGNDYIEPMGDPPQDLYIITTARKRDELEWEEELLPFGLSIFPEFNKYSNKVVVDSWNNIGKYIDIRGAFFIFDEQRVVGSGAWVKSFYKIAEKNNWILLSATPGDTWEDYIPVFVANKFYRNKTQFVREHIIYNPRVKYPQVDRYINTGKLLKLRESILVDIDLHRETVPHHEDIYAKYDMLLYRDTMKNRGNPYITGYLPCRPESAGALLVGTDISVKDVSPIMKGINYVPKRGDYVRLLKKPIENAGELCYILRKIVNTDESRVAALLELLEKIPRAIIFYNFDYELELLKSLHYGDGVEMAEWNGHEHQPIPNTNKWVYFVQYTAGAEGWNCIKTDTIIFFSQNYSYKIMHQAAGRIDRLNTPYKDLYYYHLKSHAAIDLGISRALRDKKKFNETRFVNKFGNRAS